MYQSIRNVIIGMAVPLLLTACAVPTTVPLAPQASMAEFAAFTSTVILVFRESLEAYLIVAALIASMTGASARYRKPVLLGAGLAVLASAVTWGLFHWLLLYLVGMRQQVEVIVLLLVVAVLLLTTNWFFHKGYWNNWIARFHRQKQQYLKSATMQFVGLVLLGFVSIYREGFEIVLFLQPFVLASGLKAVMLGAVVGLLGIALLGVVIWRTGMQLHYKRLLIGTGILVGGVLVILVGQTVHVLQLLGWLSATPLAFVQQLPDWFRSVFAFYPTWQGLWAQVGSAVFVIGSYYLAEYLQQRKRSRQRQERAVTSHSDVVVEAKM